MSEHVRPQPECQTSFVGLTGWIASRMAGRCSAVLAYSSVAVRAVFDQPADQYAAHGRQRQHDPNRCFRITDDVSDANVFTIVDADENEDRDDCCDQCETHHPGQIDAR